MGNEQCSEAAGRLVSAVKRSDLAEAGRILQTATSAETNSNPPCAAGIVNFRTGLTGELAICEAVRAHSTEILEFLLAMGADINAREGRLFHGIRYYLVFPCLLAHI